MPRRKLRATELSFGPMPSQVEQQTDHISSNCLSTGGPVAAHHSPDAAAQPPTHQGAACPCDATMRAAPFQPTKIDMFRAGRRGGQMSHHTTSRRMRLFPLLVLVTVTLNRFERPHPSWLACLPFTPPQPSCYWHQNQPSFAPLEPFLNGDMPPPMMIDSALPGSHPISFPHLTAFHKRRL